MRRGGARGGCVGWTAATGRGGGRTARHARRARGGGAMTPVGFLLLAIGLALPARRAIARRRERRAAEGPRRAVARFAAEVAAEVRVGLPARPAVARGAASVPAGTWAAAVGA